MPRKRSIGEVLESAFGDQLGQVAVVVPGEVVSWDRTTETALVKPVLTQPNGDVRPNVPNCPVVFPGAYWDLQVGEEGLLLVCDQDAELWWRTGQPSAPATEQQHKIGNAMFLPGVRNRTSVRVPASNTTVLAKPAALGQVRLGDPGATKSALHEDLLADLNSFLTALDTWGTAVGAFCAVPWAAGPQPSLNVIKAGISAGNYESPSVKVED